MSLASKTKKTQVEYCNTRTAYYHGRIAELMQAEHELRQQAQALEAQVWSSGQCETRWTECPMDEQIRARNAMHVFDARVRGIKEQIAQLSAKYAV